MSTETAIDLSKVFQLNHNGYVHKLEMEQGRWVNQTQLGGYGIDAYPLNDTEFFMADDWDELKPYLDAQNALTETRDHLNMGWIAPSGDYYGCSMDFLRYSPVDYSQACDEGWVLVKISGGENRFWPENWDKPLTNEQKETLTKIGFDPSDQLKSRDNSITFKDAFPNGNPVTDKILTDAQSTIDSFEANMKRLDASAVKKAIVGLRR